MALVLLKPREAGNFERGQTTCTVKQILKRRAGRPMARVRLTNENLFIARLPYKAENLAWLDGRVDRRGVGTKLEVLW